MGIFESKEKSTIMASLIMLEGSDSGTLSQKKKNVILI